MYAILTVAQHYLSCFSTDMPWDSMVSAGFELAFPHQHCQHYQLCSPCCYLHKLALCCCLVVALTCHTCHQFPSENLFLATASIYCKLISGPVATCTQHFEYFFPHLGWDTRIFLRGVPYQGSQNTSFFPYILQVCACHLITPQHKGQHISMLTAPPSTNSQHRISKQDSNADLQL